MRFWKTHRGKTRLKTFSKKCLLIIVQILLLVGLILFLWFLASTFCLPSWELYFRSRDCLFIVLQVNLTIPSAWTRSLLLYPIMFSCYLSKLFLSILKFLRINGNVMDLPKPRTSSELHKLFSLFISAFETCMGSTCLVIKNLHIYL